MTIIFGTPKLDGKLKMYSSTVIGVPYSFYGLFGALFDTMSTITGKNVNDKNAKQWSKCRVFTTIIFITLTIANDEIFFLKIGKTFVFAVVLYHMALMSIVDVLQVQKLLKCLEVKKPNYYDHDNFYFFKFISLNERVLKARNLLGVLFRI